MEAVHYHRIFLKGLRKTTNNLSEYQVSRQRHNGFLHSPTKLCLPSRTYLWYCDVASTIIYHLVQFSSVYWSFQTLLTMSCLLVQLLREPDLMGPCGCHLLVMKNCLFGKRTWRNKFGLWGNLGNGSWFRAIMLQCQCLILSIFLALSSRLTADH